MIQGDIDLTSNLDFYHDKEKKSKFNTSLVPWKKEVKSNLSSTDFTFTFYDQPTWYGLSTNSISTATSFTTLSNNTYSYYGTTTSSYSDGAIISYTDHDHNIVTYNYMNTNWTTIANIDYNLNDHSIDITPTFVDVYTNNTATFNIPISTEVICDKLYSYKKKLKSPVFKYKLKEPYESPMRRCHTCRHYTIGKCKCERVVFYSKGNILSRFRDRVKEIKESFFGRYTSTRKRMMNHDRYYDSNRKIPWLRNLDYRIYDDYITDLFEEQDYSKYLTDMSWLRIH